MNILSLIDSFIPDAIKQENGQTVLLKSKVIISLSLLYCSSLIFVVVILTVLSFLEIIVVWEAVIGSSIATSIYIGELVFFKKTARLFWAANIVMLTMFSSTTAFIALTGGWISVVMIVYICVPMCAFLMEGKKSGILWSGIIVAAYAIFLVLHIHDYKMLHIVDVGYDDYLTYFSWVYSWAIIFGGISLYGTISAHLSDELSREREELRIKSTYDSLTGVYKRHAFRDLLAETTQGVLDGRIEDFLYMDIEINGEDLTSRVEEKKVLQAAAKAIRETYDERVIVARSGGLSFLAMVDEVGESINAAEVAQVIHSSVVRVLPSNVTIYIGVVMVPDYSQDISDIMQAGRKAVQDAKSSRQDYVLYASSNIVQQDEDMEGLWFRGRFNDVVRLPL